MNSSFIEKLNNKLNMIELTSKPIVENDAAWQQHGTPNEVIDMMLEMYYENGEFKNNERILILFNVEFIKQIYFKYRDELIFGNLYFIADSQEKFNIVKRLYPNVHCLLCNEHVMEKLMEKIGEFNVKKFDVVFSNPPYNDNLDLKILEKLFDVSKNIIFIHPSSFLLDNKNIKQLFTRIKNTLFLKECILFWGNELFNIGLFVPICISHWTNITNNKIIVNDNAFLKRQYIVNNINDISIHGDSTNIKNTIDTIKTFIDKNGSLIEHKHSNNFNSKKYYTKLPVIRGHVPTVDKYNNLKFNDDFFSLISLDIKNNISIKENDISKCIVFEFDTEIERINFINYCKSKFARFCLSFYKINGNLNRGETKLIPWLDFTQEWNDAKLCKEFGISEELWQYIDNFIPDYYDDYKSGFEK